jgi:hypothetical protein
MSRPPSRSCQGARRHRAGVLLGAVLLAACGVEPQSAPEPVPAERLPRAGPTQGSTSPAVRARVWGARDQRLVPVFTELTGTSAVARLQSVLSLGAAEEPAPTVVPTGTRLLSVTQRSSLMVVDLSQDVTTAQPNHIPLVLGQLVLTVTEDPGVDEVEVRADGEPVLLISATGSVVSHPLRRSDFAHLLQGGRAPAPSR